LGPQQLSFVLGKLLPHSAKEIKACLEENSNLWEKEALKLENLSNLGVGALKLSDIEELYKEKTSQIDPKKIISLETFFSIS
jgi:hypothetical protein